MKQLVQVRPYCARADRLDGSKGNIERSSDLCTSSTGDTDHSYLISSQTSSGVTFTDSLSAFRYLVSSIFSSGSQEQAAVSVHAASNIAVMQYFQPSRYRAMSKNPRVTMCSDLRFSSIDDRGTDHSVAIPIQTSGPQDARHIGDWGQKTGKPFCHRYQRVGHLISLPVRSTS